MILLSGKPLTKGKWVVDIKRKSYVSIEQYKARYVAKGFSHVYGQNYTDTFSPTLSITAIRSLFAIAVQHVLKMRQIDVKTAFLNSTLKDENFIEQTRGFESGKRDVCKLNKCIYGLNQATPAWNQFLTKILLEILLKLCRHLFF